MQQVLHSKASIDEPCGSKLYIINRVLSQFARDVFMTNNEESDINLSEICYNHLAIWPYMYAAFSRLTFALGKLKFLPGERYLEAINEVRRLRHQEESPMKVDGVVRTGFSQIELLSMEVSGHYGLHDKPGLSGTLPKECMPCWPCGIHISTRVY